MSGATIRAATPHDGDTIARIHVETWRSTYAGIIPDVYLVRMNVGQQRMMWRQTLQGSGHRHHVVVVELAGKEVVGFASCGAARRNLLPRRAPYDGEVFTLYVAVDHQGQGHGKRLLDACFDTLREQAKTSVVVWVLAANPARFFYEASGGRKVAERIERFAGAELAELAFGWNLSAGG